MSLHCVYCGQYNDRGALVCGSCGRQLPPQPVGSVSDPTDPASWPPESPGASSSAFTTYGGDAAAYPPPSPPSWNSSPDQSTGQSTWNPGYAPNSPSAPSWPAAPQAWQPAPPPWQPAQYGAPAPGVWQPAYGVQLPPDAVSAQSRAKTAMILGIVGLFCFSLVFGPVALIMGMKSRASLQQYGIQDGQGMAMAGIVMGTIDIVLSILYFMAMLANLGG